VYYVSGADESNVTPGVTSIWPSIILVITAGVEGDTIIIS